MIHIGEVMFYGKNRIGNCLNKLITDRRSGRQCSTEWPAKYPDIITLNISSRARLNTIEVNKNKKCNSLRLT